MPNSPPPWALYIVGVLGGITLIVIAVTSIVNPAGDLAFAIKTQWSRLLDEPPPITIKAMSFSNRSNVELAGDRGGPGGKYGQDVLMNSGGPPNMVEWITPVPQAGRYRLYVRYASAELRPVRILVNGTKWCDNRLSEWAPCGWAESCQNWKEQGVLQLQPGDTIRFESKDNNVIPHIKALRLIGTQDKVVCFDL